ncbi:aldehyde dehydrogenase [Virgisporangium aliadipatigenens]|uniref:Aldehyde dehydrogenase n=1 Tax=Virgisporangium aliadipatigenens TaxID=741659 RepID=A0A8J3YLH3_9ACTN|nr:aldehyde dehydrogenase family protein [Virgisporangium aliadipatigenens]GIJ47629.1 aldehyde dehydrogenase [Virgisporangium aliadipatigenens]
MEASLRRHDTIYVGGEWIKPANTDTIEVINPATEQVIGVVPAGGPEDVDAAVAAARGAADEWAATPPDKRAAHLAELRDALNTHRRTAAMLVTSELGAPVRIADRVHVGTPIDVLDSYVELLSTYEFHERIGHSLVLSEPVGVVGAIAPWNYPLHQAVVKIAAALAAGCTVILKPAEETPLNAFLLAEAVHEAGLPAGVFNLVPGGPAVGESLTCHESVDMVSFTGSTAVGKRIGELCGKQIKRASLELGGKSASVALPGGDLATAVKVTVANVMLNSGQTCSAWTRLLVPNERMDEAADIARSVVARYTCGDPLDPETRVGPLVSEAQRARVLREIQTGTMQGAQLVAGGEEPPPGLDRGYYVRPTVFSHVRPDATIAVEEIFGPVLSIIGYADRDEALWIANGTEYGLAGAVWAADEESAVAFARQLKTGQVDINGGRFNVLAPFGGYKRSGIGREFGRHGLEEFLEYKSLQL